MAEDEDKKDDKAKDEAPDTRPYGVPRISGKPEQDLPTGDLAMRLGRSKSHVKRMVRRSQQQGPLSPEEKIMMLRMGEVVKDSALRLLSESVEQGPHSRLPGLEFPKRKLIKPGPGELLIRPKLGEFIVQPTEDELKEHGGITPLVRDQESLDMIAQMQEDTQHTRAAQLQEMFAFLSDEAQREIVDYLKNNISALCEHAYYATKAEDPDITAAHRHEMFNAVLNINESIESLGFILKTQAAHIELAKEQNYRALRASVKDLVEANSARHLTTLSSDERTVYADLVNRAIVNASKLTPLPETASEVSESMSEHITNIREDLHQLCNSIATIITQNDSLPDVETIREQVLTNLIDVQSSVLDTIRFLKERGTSSSQAGDIVADGISELVVAESNRAIANLPAGQAPAFVGALNYVMEGVFHSADRGTGQSGGGITH